MKRKVVEEMGGGGNSDPSDLGAKIRKKLKTKGKRPHGRDRTISGHDLSHPEVRGGRATLNSAKNG